MSKHDVLTEVEMSRFKFRKHMLRRIDSCCARTGVPRTEFNILDYGCGRGRAVAWLRASGYNAFGVDIDPEPVRNGRDLLLGRGEDPDAVLRVIGREGRTSFPNGFFHFVFSQQVMEHVEDLDGVVEELAGITRPGGMGVHAYPAHRQMMERHLLMPAVHWVPKGALRKACIALCVACGLEPRWRRLRDAGFARRVSTYYDYSCHKTYYRNCAAVRSAFEAAGFEVEFCARGTPRWSTLSLVSRAVRSRFLIGLFDAWRLRFMTVELLTKRLAAGT